jgi:hypothetical protein
MHLGRVGRGGIWISIDVFQSSQHVFSNMFPTGHYFMDHILCLKFYSCILAAQKEETAIYLFWDCTQLD